MQKLTCPVDQREAESMLQENEMFTEDQSIRINPYPLYEACRVIGPVTEEPHTGVLVVTRLRDVIEGERRFEDFSSAVVSMGPHVRDVVPQRPDESACPFGNADLSAEIDEWRETTDLRLIPVITLDPPRHTDFRSLVNKLFAPERKKKMEPRLRKFAHDLVNLFIDTGEAEWVSGYSMPYTYFTMNEAMDFPRADEEEMFRVFKERIDNPSRGGSAATGRPDDVDPETNPVLVSEGRFFEYLTERRANPQDDVLSDIATARMSNGELPPIEDLVGISGVMYGAGQGTTMHLIGSMMQIVASDQALQKRLRDNPDLIENFVEECLRIEPPVQGLFRIAKRDTELGGVKIPAGKIVWMCYAAGNRDPEVFENPDVLDPERQNANKAVSFGAGRHFCPGQPLAKLEAKITFEEVLKRMDNIRLKDPEKIINMPSWFVVKGPERLDIVFDKIA